MTAPPAPIAILSFNRPDYLRRVLESLTGQDGGRLEERAIVLFQDGARNAISGAERARESEIDACVELFRTAFPAGRIERSPTNIGVALNFERAETHVFETLDADAAIFLEDDLVLAPAYLRALEALIEIARRDERIGYVAAYGHHWVPLSEQRKQPGRYVLLEHNWGFALPRRQWLRNKPYVDQYLALVRDVDYRERPRRDIHRLYHGWGMGCPGDSQDVTKTMACCLTGAVKLNTTTCLGRYIGEQGLHMNPAEFVRRKYPLTELFVDPLPDFPPLTDADYDRVFAPQHRWAVERPCDVD
jgi:hypothetical protein